MKELICYIIKLIWPAAKRFFFSNEKGPTWNTPKKGSLSRKRPEKDERVGRGHFHERVISRFVPEIRPFEKKFRDKIFPNSKYIFLFIELSESYFAGHF